MYLQRLIYVSENRKPCKDEIIKIQKQSISNNAKNNITGLLCFNADYYVQVLEGSRNSISETFLKIYNDKRHQKIELIECKSISLRSFESWAMKFVPLSRLGRELILKYSTSDNFDPKKMESTRLIEFCKDVAMLDNYE